MLEIELKNAGCKVVSENTSEDSNAVYVYVHEMNAKTIEITSSSNSDKRTFARPFYVRDAVSYISSLVNIYGNKNISAAPVYETPDREAYYDLNINEDTHKVTFRGEDISLTKREYELLFYLHSNKGKPISRDEAVSKVWKYDFTGDTNIVDVYIRYLREKLDDRYNTKLIYTVRHKGYMIK